MTDHSHGTVIHHSDGTIDTPAHWYDYAFDNGRVGDWWWSTVGGHGDDGLDDHRVMWLVVPLPTQRHAEGSYGPVTADGLGELTCIYPSHEGPTAEHPSGNWAAPGDVNGWDGDDQHPTFRPSIFVGGTSEYPGWHGYMTRGQLETVG